MGGAAAPDSAIEDAIAFEFPPEVVEQLEDAMGRGTAQREMAIWPENWPVVKAFAEIATQWRVEPLGMAGARYIGLDYTAAKAGLELADIAVTPEQWRALRVMEREAVRVLNSREG